MSDLQTSTPITESFAALFEESLTKQDMRAGEVISAEVVRVEHSFVVVNAGLKSVLDMPPSTPSLQALGALNASLPRGFLARERARRYAEAGT